MIGGDAELPAETRHADVIFHAANVARLGNLLAADELHPRSPVATVPQPNEMLAVDDRRNEHPRLAVVREVLVSEELVDEFLDGGDQRDRKSVV